MGEEDSERKEGRERKKEIGKDHKYVQTNEQKLRLADVSLEQSFTLT